MPITGTCTKGQGAVQTLVGECPSLAPARRLREQYRPCQLAGACADSLLLAQARAVGRSSSRGMTSPKGVRPVLAPKLQAEAV